MSWPTSRRYSRTLAEAFPREHANPITHEPRGRGRIRGWLLAIFIGVALATLVAYSI